MKQWAQAGALLFGILVSSGTSSSAGDFELDWGGAHNWTTNTLGPTTFAV